MKYEIIGTGSKGNAAVIAGHILVDCGVSYSRLKKYAGDLKIVFLTHAHGDHFNKTTIKNLASDKPNLRFACGEWLAKSLLDCGVSKSKIDILESGCEYSFGHIIAEPFALTHNVPNVGYKLTVGGERLIYATDTGSLDGIAAKNFDLYLIEANHTEREIESRIAEKLRSGEYPYEQKARENHLSKEKADDFIYDNIGQNGSYVYLHTHDGIII